LRNEFLAAQAQERSLTNALEAQKQDALGLNRKGIEYGVLQRDVESNRQIYESLLQRAKETAVSGELNTSNSKRDILSSSPYSSTHVPNSRGDT
jgi:uncharacterized protein involved in exopolysaccharide biosynthesis